MKERFAALKSRLSWRIALAGALGAVGLAAAGTALAAGDKQDGDGDRSVMPMPGGPPGMPAGGFEIGFAGPGPGEGDIAGDFAAELADHLDGVSAGEVSTALKEIANEHESERRDEMAKAISAELDGVDAGAVADALKVAEDKMRASFEDGDMPDPDLFTQTLADELGVGTDEINSALDASREAAMKAHGLDGEIGPAPIGGPGMPMPGGFPPPPATDGGDLPPPAPGDDSGSQEDGN